jgi:ubiquinone/menaquinone biosynthesis C-methylase UbiE
MLSVAGRRAADLGVTVDLREGDVESLDFANSSFDSVVCTLVMCSVPNDRLAIAEVARVLKPGGRFVLVEHVRSNLPPIRVIQRALDPLLLWLEQDHLLRDPMDHLPNSGFRIDVCERLGWGIIERVVAHKPPLKRHL